MKDNDQCRSSLENLLNDLNSYFEISLEEDDVSIHKWAQMFSGQVESFCHVLNNCDKKDCLSYKSECGRCWLQVGTLCDNKIQNNFSDKRKSCPKCKVYKNYVGDDIVKNIRELTFSLIQNLLLKKQELKEAISEIKTLQGIIPICCSCHSIRDDKENWNKLEEYISNHSDAQFSHSYCPDCLRKLYPELAAGISFWSDTKK